jgi:DHA2 family multidrug resistance protein
VPEIDPKRRLLLITLSAALLGAFTSGLGAQMVSSALNDLQGTIGASADEASWITTAYSMGEILMIPLAGMFIQVLGLRRFMVWLCVGFIVTALGSALAHTLATEVLLRAVQGLLGGAFGVAAFGMTFRAFGGRNIAFGLMLLTFCQTFPANLGPVLAGWLTDLPAGWPTVYWVEIGLTLVVLAEVLISADQQCFDWRPLRAVDWTGYALVGPGLALLILALSQGNRRFWFESPMIVWSLIGAGLSLGAFIIIEWGRHDGIVDFDLMGRRSFGAAVMLNVFFRFGLLTTSYLAPQFLGQIQGYRPLEVGHVLIVTTAVQLLSFPLAYWLVRRVAPRAPLFIGLMLFAAAGFLSTPATGLSAGEQFLLSQALLGAAPALFIVPLLVIGTQDVKPTEGPSASTFFNGSRSIGQQLGAAFLATLIRHREQFHSVVLNESVTAVSGGGRIESLKPALARVLFDPGRQTAAATAALAGQVRGQAFVLAYEDAFLAVAVILCVGALLTIALPPTPPHRG